MNENSFWQGFRQCANEVTQFLLRFDQKAGIDFLQYIRDNNMMPIQNLDINYNTLNKSNKQQYNMLQISSVSNMFINNSYRHYIHPSSHYHYQQQQQMQQQLHQHHEISFQKSKILENPHFNQYSKTISNVSLLDDDVTVWRPW